MSKRPTASAGQGVLTVPEVAEALRISERTAYHLIRTKEIPSIQIGRRIRVLRTAVDTILEQGTAAVAEATEPAFEDLI